MDHTVILAKLQARYGNDLQLADQQTDIPTVVVSASVIHETIAFLKSEGYGFLTDLTGIHYPDQDLEFGVIYHMHDLKENKRMRIKSFVSREKPVVPTVTDLFAGANWMERETYDFYGILFEGHPNLTRILNVEYMDYFPLRKEYPLEDSTREDKDDRYFGR
jgi:NADH-quinone oxidoreductase subunit C